MASSRDEATVRKAEVMLTGSFSKCCHQGGLAVQVVGLSTLTERMMRRTSMCQTAYCTTGAPIEDLCGMYSTPLQGDTAHALLLCHTMQQLAHRPISLPSTCLLHVVAAASCHCQAPSGQVWEIRAVITVVVVAGKPLVGPALLPVKGSPDVVQESPAPLCPSARVCACGESPAEAVGYSSRSQTPRFSKKAEGQLMQS